MKTARSTRRSLQPQRQMPRSVTVASILMPSAGLGTCPEILAVARTTSEPQISFLLRIPDVRRPLLERAYLRSKILKQDPSPLGETPHSSLAQGSYPYQGLRIQEYPSPQDHPVPPSKPLAFFRLPNPPSVSRRVEPLGFSVGRKRRCFPSLRTTLSGWMHDSMLSRSRHCWRKPGPRGAWNEVYFPTRQEWNHLIREDDLS